MEQVLWGAGSTARDRAGADSAASVDAAPNAGCMPSSGAAAEAGAWPGQHGRSVFSHRPRATASRLPGDQGWLVRHYGVVGQGEVQARGGPEPHHGLLVSLGSAARVAGRLGDKTIAGNLRHGDMSFVPAGTGWEARFPADLPGILLLIPPADLAAPAAQVGAQVDTPLHGVLMPRVFTLVQTLEREIHDPGPGTRLIYEAAVLELAAALSGRCTEGADRIAISPVRLKRVIDHVMANLESDIGLADMAGIAGLSPFHFARVFRLATGLSPYRFVMERRMALACELLADPAIPIVEISHRCGYAGQAHFTTAFQQRVGMTPGRYRRKMCGC